MKLHNEVRKWINKENPHYVMLNWAKLRVNKQSLEWDGGLLEETLCNLPNPLFCSI